MSFPLSGYQQAPATTKITPYSAHDYMSIDGFKKWRETSAMPIAHIKGFESGMAQGELYENFVRHRLIQFNVIAFDGAPLDMTGYTAAVLGFLNHRKSNFAIAFVPAPKVEEFWKGWSDPAMREKFAGRLMVCGFDLEADKKRYDLVVTDATPLKSVPAELHADYYAQRIAFKATAGKTAISLGGAGGAAAAVTEACLKDGVSWQILALSRGQTESSPTLLDWAHSKEGTPNVFYERGLDENENKGYFNPPKVESKVAHSSNGDCPCSLPDWLPAVCVLSLGVVIAIGFIRLRK